MYYGSVCACVSEGDIFVYYGSVCARSRVCMCSTV